MENEEITKLLPPQVQSPRVDRSRSDGPLDEPCPDRHATLADGGHHDRRTGNFLDNRTTLAEGVKFLLQNT